MPRQEESLQDHRESEEAYEKSGILLGWLEKGKDQHAFTFIDL